MKNPYNGSYQSNRKERTKGDLIVAAITLAVVLPVVIIVITIIFQLAK